jgi:LacI family transcriptional regulator
MPEKKLVPVYDNAGRLNMSGSAPTSMLTRRPYASRIARDKGLNFAVPLVNQSNYFTNHHRNKKTSTIGVIVHEINSHFITSALKGIAQVVAEAGFEVVITHSQEKMEKEIANAHILFDKRVDGLITSLAVDTTNFEHFNLFSAANIPMVFFDRVERIGDSGMVITDNFKSGYLATEHLIGQGCKRIAIVTSGLERNVYAQRYKGFRDALDCHGIKFNEQLLIVADISEDAGTEVGKTILEMNELPDGLFITNDLVAATCMHTLKNAGLAIPQDIAIVGFNNEPIGRLTTPTLTTINYSGLEIGRAAGSKMLYHLSGKRSALRSRTALVQSELIVRGSSLRRG